MCHCLNEPLHDWNLFYIKNLTKTLKSLWGWNKYTYFHWRGGGGMTWGVGEGGVGYTPKFHFNLNIQNANCKIWTAFTKMLIKVRLLVAVFWVVHLQNIQPREVRTQNGRRRKVRPWKVRGPFKAGRGIRKVWRRKVQDRKHFHPGWKLIDYPVPFLVIYFVVPTKHLSHSCWKLVDHPVPF